MSESTAVLDAPAQSDTQTQPPADTQDVSRSLPPELRAEATATVTDSPAAAQTDTPDDAGDQLHTDAIEAARALALEEGKELGKKEALEERLSAQGQQAIDDFKQHFPATAQSMRAELTALGIVDPQAQQRVLRHLDAYNLKALDVGRRLAHGPVEDAIEVILPKDEYPKFVERANGKGPKEFLEEFAESAALRTKAIRGLTLEDAISHSGKLKAEITKALAEKYDEGRKKGREDPPGDGYVSTNGSGTAPGRVTYAQIQKMTPKQVAELPGDVFMRALEEG